MLFFSNRRIPSHFIQRQRHATNDACCSFMALLIAAYCSSFHLLRYIAVAPHPHDHITLDCSVFLQQVRPDYAVLRYCTLQYFDICWTHCIDRRSNVAFHQHTNKIQQAFVIYADAPGTCFNNWFLYEHMDKALTHYVMQHSASNLWERLIRFRRIKAQIYVDGLINRWLGSLFRQFCSNVVQSNLAGISMFCMRVSSSVHVGIWFHSRALGDEFARGQGHEFQALQVQSGSTFRYSYKIQDATPVFDVTMQCRTDLAKT